MNVRQTNLPGVVLLEPKLFGDDRGFFIELYHATRYESAGIPSRFVQDNFSRSVRGTLRGLHFQEPCGQGKLVQVIIGSVYDVAVDVRRGSPTFGKWFAVELSEKNRHQLWIPAGFAHGFCVTSESADFLYKCSEFYSPANERSISYADPELAIPWPIASPILSAKDAAAPLLSAAPVLPVYIAP